MPGSMLGPEMNAGLDAGPIQKMCSFSSVPGQDFWGKFDISNIYHTCYFDDQMQPVLIA